MHMYIAAIVKHVVKAFLKELRDPKKTTYIYLSIRNRDLLHEDITNKDIINSMNTAIVNNSCKSIFGVATKQISVYANIRIIYKGGIAMAKKYSNFATRFKKISKDCKLCI